MCDYLSHCGSKTSSIYPLLTITVVLLSKYQDITYYVLILKWKYYCEVEDIQLNFGESRVPKTKVGMAYYYTGDN